MWFPCAHHVVSRWTPFGFQVDTMWFPGGQHRVSKVDTMWFLQDTTGFPHGCHVVSIWTPCVVEVTTRKPAQKTALHEANWLPCCYCNITFIVCDGNKFLHNLLEPIIYMSHTYQCLIGNTEYRFHCRILTDWKIPSVWLKHPLFEFFSQLHKVSNVGISGFCKGKEK